MKLSEVGFFLVLISFASRAQFSAPDEPAVKKRAMDEYTFPIEPGKTAVLTGTMGELRATHFHGGLDINTHTIGYQVQSASDGYIARATASTSGYGNALYIRHTDGHTTLYAHLNEFLGPVADHIRQERYRRKQSEVDLHFAPNQFPVKKGEVVALSGNTGSSGGPHLHFELRDENNDALNPLIAGFGEVVDNTPPLVQKVALRTLSPASRINDQYGRFEFHVVRQGAQYLLPSPILATGRIGIEVLAHDKQENSRFKFGINLIEVYVDGERIFIQTIDKIRFSENRQILALMDYEVMETKGQRYNRLYVADGNHLPLYQGSTQTNGITVGRALQKIEIRLTDYFNNTSTIQLHLQPSPPVADVPFVEPVTKITTELAEPFLKVTVPVCAGSDSTLRVFYQGQAKTLARAYGNHKTHVFLVDLKDAYPDSVVSCRGSWVSHWVTRVPSQSEFMYYSDRLEVEFPPRALFDTLLLRVRMDSARVRERFWIGSPTVPLLNPVRVTYKPQPQYEHQRTHGIYRKEGRSYAYLGNNFRNGRYQFSTLSFGEFEVLNDTLAPAIKPISINSSVARLRIRDDLSGISYFEANINGQWLLMNYDYKSGVLYSERLDRSQPLRGDFELKVVDNAGNESVFKQKIL